MAPTRMFLVLHTRTTDTGKQGATLPVMNLSSTRNPRNSITNVVGSVLVAAIVLTGCAADETNEPSNTADTGTTAPSASTTAPAATTGADTGTTSAPDPSVLGWFSKDIENWFSNNTEPTGPAEPLTTPDQPAIANGASNLPAEHNEFGEAGEPAERPVKTHEPADTTKATVQQCYRDALVERWGDTSNTDFDTTAKRYVKFLEGGDAAPGAVSKIGLLLTDSCGWPPTAAVVPERSCIVHGIIERAGLDEAYRIVTGLQVGVVEAADVPVLEQLAERCGVPYQDIVQTDKEALVGCYNDAYREYFGDNKTPIVQYNSDLQSGTLSTVVSTTVHLLLLDRCGYPPEENADSAARDECFVRELLDRHGLDESARLLFDAAVNDDWDAVLALSEPSEECGAYLDIFFTIFQEDSFFRK